MRRNIVYWVLVATLLTSFAAGCAAPTPVPPTVAPKADAAGLKITGKVQNTMSWTEEQVKAMPTMQSTSTNKEGQSSTYTGVSLKTLLDKASVQADATTLVFVAEDAFTAEVPLADAQACKDCIVSFRDKGGFSAVMPGFSNKVQVKGVVEIQVK